MAKSKSWPNGNIMKFLAGLFKSKKEEQAALSEVELLRRRIELLQHLLDDYRSSPVKYARAIDGPVPDAYNQLVLDKVKLEMQYHFLTKWY
jgi:hypothetical protein